MDHATPLPLANWQNFYVIVGSAAGALTGLQFVVIALIAQTRATGSMREIRAFGTPTVIHFCSALLISALTAAPWQALTNFGICLGSCGVAGVVYSLSVLRHARKAAYKPDLEDWIWYTAFPLVAHVALVAAALLLWTNAAWSLFTLAADTLFFLLLGVHNSWDTVTYIAVQYGEPGKPEQTDQTEHPGHAKTGTS
ncbi:MAG: hypothetical protein M3Y72_01105 [Acidobacteriota bacterium]|nr:hypothetical protein [Acidobacteriota bacterium]